ncbi:hypothetical protein GCM10010320_53390 [Streptomyces caelestis]|nr:hypothetical protein GCM10010320_53390 [Streptomyces caelestis]
MLGADWGVKETATTGATKAALVETGRKHGPEAPGPVSTVFSQSGTGSSDSKEDANLRSASSGASGSATATPGAPGPERGRPPTRPPNPLCAELSAASAGTLPAQWTTLSKSAVKDQQLPKCRGSVKGVGCGIRRRRPGFFRRGTDRALEFPRGLNSDKTHGQPCVRC